MATYISSMPHNIGGVTNLEEKSISKFENTPPNDDEGGVGGMNLLTQFFKYVCYQLVIDEAIDFKI